MQPVYLDYAATTPCDPVVFERMKPYFLEIYGNSNSFHVYGSKAQEGLYNARRQIAKDLNAEHKEVIFTSGASEASNIAILRTIDRTKCDFFTAKTQHASVISIANNLQSHGTNVHYLKVDHDGLLDLNVLEEELKKSTELSPPGLVSVCWVNNETGTMQDIKKISDLCHKYGSLLHVDGTQAFGRFHIDVKDLDIDFMSASGHKIYAPKGIGVLYCKSAVAKYLRIPRANPDVEFGIRAGTVPVALCVGMAEASRIAQTYIESELERLKLLRKEFIDTMKHNLEEIYVNGSPTYNYPGIINMSFRGCEGEALMMESPRIAISSGSACTSNKLTISHVLGAMGVDPDIAQSSLRITMGRPTTVDDIKIATEDLTNATQKLRAMSPIWDMIKAGIDINSTFKRGIFKK